MAEEIRLRNKKNRYVCARALFDLVHAHAQITLTPCMDGCACLCCRRRSGDLLGRPQSGELADIPEIQDSYYVEPHKILGRSSSVNAQRVFKVDSVVVLAGVQLCPCLVDLGAWVVCKY